MKTKFDQDRRFSAHRYLARQLYLGTYKFILVWIVFEIETTTVYDEVLDDKKY